MLSDGVGLQTTKTGASTFTYSEATGYIAMITADLNGDGLDDIILTSALGERVAWLSAGDGSALAVELDLPAWSRASAPIGGDDLSPVSILSWGRVLD